MDNINILLLSFGIIMILTELFAIIKPRLFAEWTERQFVFHRIRIVAGSLLIIISLIASFYLFKEISKTTYLLSFLSMASLVIGLLMISFPDLLRKTILTLAEKDDKFLRIMASIIVLIGIIMILVAIF